MTDDIYDKFSRTTRRDNKSGYSPRRKLDLMNRPKTHLGLSSQTYEHNEKFYNKGISRPPLNTSNIVVNQHAHDIQVFHLTSPRKPTMVAGEVTAIKVNRSEGDRENVTPLAVSRHSSRYRSAKMRGLDIGQKYPDIHRAKRSRELHKNIPIQTLLPLEVSREAVVNVVYKGQPDHNEELTETREVTDRNIPIDGRKTPALVRSLTPVHKVFVQRNDYPVYFEEDITHNPQETLFMYQVIDFERFTENVPTFVQQDIRKNGRLLTETLILRLNYLRRRRQIGETSTLGRQLAESNTPATRQSLETTTPATRQSLETTTPATRQSVELNTPAS